MEANELELEIREPSRGQRLRKSLAARMRRRMKKTARMVHEYKEEKDAVARFKSQRRQEILKRKKLHEALDKWEETL